MFIGDEPEFVRGDLGFGVQGLVVWGLTVFGLGFGI